MEYCDFICFLYLLSNTAAIEIILRKEWGARDPTSTPQSVLVDPVSHVVIHHSATARCANTAECMQSVRNFQDLHMDVNNWADIGYNFVVGEDGNVYEGRGWGITGAHAVPYNAKSVGICIIGTFIDVLPNEKALNAVKKLIAFGVGEEKIALDFRMLGHRQAASTECPGEALFDEIKKWPHWTDTLEE